MGTVVILASLDIESHLSITNIETKTDSTFGRTCWTTFGKLVNVFSKITPETFFSYLLAVSIATAPPIDCPYSTSFVPLVIGFVSRNSSVASMSI
ncbi:hypothetical protein AYI69_g6808 [Smittium culicis]|uniref:Uncharacterized protein n=1 Tax=Smittium culicis TaxID=133412 RepID=A0A1R1XWC5_9FUNG|nr:hypothetical protein AYI69_g6808 [Smittium culicis]